MSNIPNRYLHFGDFDFEGIRIYLSSYKKPLGQRATFFVPDGIETALSARGNRTLYNEQTSREPRISDIGESGILELIRLMHRYKKALEQEKFITLVTT